MSLRLAVACARQEAEKLSPLLRELERRGTVRPIVFERERHAFFPAEALEHAQADVLLAVGPSAQGRLAALRRSHGRIPILLRPAAPPHDGSRILRSLRDDFLFRLECRYADAVLCAGSNDRKRCLRLGIAERKLHDAPFAVDNAHFAGSPHCREAAGTLRARLGIAEDEKLLLYAGKFDFRKGVHILLEQFLFLRRSGNGEKWHFALAGSGECEETLRQMAAEDSHIHLLPLPGAQELPSLLRAADLCALTPRTGLPWGALINGAMAAQRPVLVTEKAGCAPDLVEPGATGWSVDSAHPELWFDYVKGISRERLAAMGEAAGRKIRNWTPAAFADAVERAIPRKNR